MVPASGPGWTSWWRWGAAPGSGCTPAICGAARPASRPRSGGGRPRASASATTCTPTAVQHDPGVAAAAARPAGPRPGAHAGRPRRPAASGRRCSPGTSSATSTCSTSIWAAARRRRGAGRAAGHRGGGRPRSRPAGEWVIDLLIEAGLNVGGHLDRPALTDGDLAWLDGRRSGTAPGRTASTRASIPTPAATRRSPGWSRTICRPARRPGTSGPPATCRRTPPTSTGCGTGGGWRPAWPPTSASSAPAGSTARATYDAPRELAAGVDLVIVNGAVTWRDGRAVTTGFPGRLAS